MLPALPCKYQMLSFRCDRAVNVLLHKVPCFIGIVGTDKTDNPYVIISHVRLFMIISHVKVIAFQLYCFPIILPEKTVVYLINRKIHG